jgi:hypothetical protein
MTEAKEVVRGQGLDEFAVEEARVLISGGLPLDVPAIHAEMRAEREASRKARQEAEEKRELARLLRKHGRPR